MSKKIEISITGKVIGVQREGKSFEDAAGEIVLQAEMFGNNGPSRIHMSPVEPGAMVLLDDYQTAVLRTEGDPEAPMQRLYAEGGTNERRLLWVCKMLYPLLMETDQFKKAIFYGKQPNYGPDIDHAQYMVNEFTCGVQMTRRIHAVLGLLTECGELLELLQRSVFNGEHISDETWNKEFGDCAWYQVLGVATGDQKLSQCATKNIDKLRRRYPEKFTESLAQNHDSE